MKRTYRICLQVVCLGLLLFSCRHMLAQDNWIGQAQCQLNVQTDGYVHQEIQTWKITDGAPAQQGAMQVYPGTWSTNGQGGLQRMQGPQALAAQWTTNAPEISAPIRVFIRASDRRLIITAWHAQLLSRAATKLARQSSVEGAAPTQFSMTSDVYEWQFPPVEDVAGSTNVSGTGTIVVGGSYIPQHSAASSETANCTWQFSKGASGVSSKTLREPVISTHPQLGATDSPGVSTTAPSSGGPMVMSPPTAVPPTKTALPGSELTPTIQSLTQITPNSVKQGQQNVAVTLTGKNTAFVQGTTTADFGAGINVVSLTVTSPTSASAIVNLDRSASRGYHTVTVSTGSQHASSSNGSAGEAPDTFRVELLRPMLSAISPAVVAEGQQGVTVDLTAHDTFFQQGVTTANFGSNISVVSLTVHSNTTATAVINIDKTATTGSRGVSLTTGTDTAQSPPIAEGYSPVVLQVRRPQMFLTAISPASVAQGQQGVTVDLTTRDTSFQQGVTTANFGPNISVVSLTVHSNTTATAVINIDKTATTGSRGVSLTTGTDTAQSPPIAEGYSPVVLQVRHPLLYVFSASPTSVAQGAQNVSVDLTAHDTSFQQGVTTADLGTGITVTSLTVTSPTTATAVINVDPSAPAGRHDITVTTGNEVTDMGAALRWDTTPKWFSVTETLTETPLNRPIAGSLTPTTTPTSTPGKTLAPTQTTISKTTTQIASLPAPPTITMDSSMVRCNMIVDFFINGVSTHFIQGSTRVDFGPKIQVLGTTVLAPNSTRIHSQVFIAADAPGKHTVTVTTGSEVAALAGPLIVTQPCETADSRAIPNGMTPSSIPQGTQNVTVNIGTVVNSGEIRDTANLGLTQGVTRADFGVGITVVSLTVTSPGSATAVINIARDAPAGKHTLALTTASFTATADFTVDAGTNVVPAGPVASTVTQLPTASPKPESISMVPAITQISPDHAQEVKNQTPPSNFAVTITGKYSHFDQATTKVDFAIPSSVSVASVTVNSPTSLTAYLNLTRPPFAGYGIDRYIGYVSVTTGAEVLQLDGGFSVYVPIEYNPIAQLAPSTGQQGQSMSVALTGQFTHFATGSTTFIDYSISSPVRVTVNSPTSATLSFTILPNAQVGNTRLQLMTSTSGGPEQVFGGFAITPMLPDSYSHALGGATYLWLSTAGQVKPLEGQLPSGTEDWFQLECDTSICTISLPNVNAELYPPSTTVAWQVVADVLNTASNQSVAATIGAQGPSQTTVTSGIYNIHVYVPYHSPSRYRLVLTGGSK